MSQKPDRRINILLNVSASHPELLTGLDIWIELGLLSDTQVQTLAQQFLSCALPEAVVVPLPPRQPKVTATVATSDFITVAEEIPKPERSRPNFAQQAVQSLFAEMSVRWLLFLGLFLVILASGGLVASQWERFAPEAQYGVLFAYTLAFWATSRWADRQRTLMLTAQGLKIVTLLLVPVNFWAMDRFGAWGSPIKWVMVAIATLALSWITARLYRHQPHASSLRLMNALGLSYLHWGWAIPGFPLIAVYFGTIGSAIATFLDYRQRDDRHSIRSDLPPETSSLSAIALPGTIVYALMILLMRAIFVAQVEVSQLGLAIGICGWLFVWLSQHQAQRVTTQENTEKKTANPYLIWTRIGGGLMVLGWLVAISQPWQAIAISGLGLWIFGDRLLQFWQRSDLAAMFAIGWQILWLIGRVIPRGFRSQAISTATDLTAAHQVPGTLLSLTWFPYLILMLGVTNWFYHRSEKTGHLVSRDLGRFGDLLALGFGTFLTLLGLANPAVRSLNLLLSTVTLFTVTQRRYPLIPGLIYLNHTLALFALTSTLDWLKPNLSLALWGIILLAIALAELTFVFLNPRFPLSVQENHTHVLAIWRQSAWYLGLAVAVLSYWLLWANTQFSLQTVVTDIPLEGFGWISVPVALMAIAFRSESLQRSISSWLSAIALILFQFLTLPFPQVRLLGLSVGVILMVVNTQLLKAVPAAIITVGFGLAWLSVLLWQGFLGFAPLSETQWLIAIALTTIGLWMCRQNALHHPGRVNWAFFPTIYAPAFDSWALLVCSLELFFLTVHSTLAYGGIFIPSILAVIATGLTMGAIAYRTYQIWAIQSTSSNLLWQYDLSFYSLAWCLELLATQALSFTERSVLNLAIANIALGLLVQLLGDWWQRRTQHDTLPTSLQIIPLIYGAFAALLRVNFLTNTTGLITLGLSFIAIGIGRRQARSKGLVYLGTIGLSIAAYEILYSQISRLPIGDRLILMAALGASILSAYRLLVSPLSEYLRLSEIAVKRVAHFHWGISSCCLMLAMFAPVSATDLIGIGTAIVLTSYALWQGRYPTGRGAAEVWIYLGILQAAAVVTYIADQLKFGGFLLPWVSAIAAVISYFLYALPWENWGWPKQPWQRAAISISVIAAVVTFHYVLPASLLIVAAFYGFLAFQEQQIRFTYLSVLFLDWAILNWLLELQITDALAYTTLVGLSVLYFAQFEPALKPRSQRSIRHVIRLIAIGAICTVALIDKPWYISGSLSLLVTFAGLVFRIRAFLYVGTGIFLLNATNQLLILHYRYSILRWIIGLSVGILFIWIAATFETRREQIATFLQNWLEELENWQ